MQVFFRRVKAVKTPGCPRFISWESFNTAWKGDLNRRILDIKGVGEILHT